MLGNGENPTEDRLYSKYVKAHAYKLLLLTSHGCRTDGEKLLLWVEAGAGQIHDNSALVEAQQSLTDLLIPQALGLGDHAFHGCFRVIVPYSKLNL